MDQAQVGHTVRKLRLAQGWSQVELARRTGLSPLSIQKIELGSGNPTLSTLNLLARELSLRLAWGAQIPDWERLIELGMPLQGSEEGSPKGGRIREKTLAMKGEDLVTEIGKAIAYFSQRSVDADQGKGRKKIQFGSEREWEAFQALMLAVILHYPRFFKRHFSNGVRGRWIPKKMTGRLLKLKRLAFARISEYL